MTVTAKALVPTTALAAGTATPYTCAVQAAILDKITVFNSNATDPVTVQIMLRGVEAPSNDNTLMDKIIAARSAYLCPEITGHTLNKGQSFTIVTSSGDAVLRVSGREVT